MDWDLILQNNLDFSFCFSFSMANNALELTGEVDVISQAKVSYFEFIKFHMYCILINLWCDCLGEHGRNYR